MSTRRLTRIVTRGSSLAPNSMRGMVHGLVAMVEDRLLGDHAIHLSNLNAFAVGTHAQNGKITGSRSIGPGRIATLHYRFAPRCAHPTTVNAAHTLVRNIRFRG